MLLEVITHAVAKLRLDWPDEKVCLVCSKLDCYLTFHLQADISHFAQISTLR